MNPVSISNGVTFLPDDRGQRFTRLAGLHFNLILGAINFDLRATVKLLDGAHDSHFAVAASHAGDGKVVVHETLLDKTPLSRCGMMRP
jgi:hypothetical protein